MNKSWLACCALGAGVALGCGDSTGSSGPPAVATLTVSPNPVVLARGDSVQLTVNALDAGGHPVTGVAISFSSADTAKAVVSSTGMLRARGKGSTTISVTGGGKSAQAPVTITVPIGGVLVAPSDTTLLPQQTKQLRAYVVDIDGDTIPGAPVTYATTNPLVVTVTGGGLVTAIGIGNASVRAENGTFVALANVTVPDTVTSIPDSGVIAQVPLTGAPLAVAVKGDVAYVTRVSASYVQVLSLTSLTFVDSILVGSLPCGIVLNSAGTKAYVANQGSNSISIIDLVSRTVTGTITVNGNPLPVALSPSDSILFVTTNVDRLYKIRLATNSVVDSLPLPATSHYLLAHPNDTLLYVATRAAGSVLEVNWRTMTVARTFTLGGTTQNMVLAPDRSALYVVNEVTNRLHAIALPSGAMASHVPLEAGAHSLGLSGDGTKLYAGLLFAGKVTVINRVTRQRLYNVVTGGTVRWMAADAARGRMVVVNEGGWVDILR